MKKGFTLIELIGVIIILGVIAIIAFPPILNMIRNSKKDIDEVTKTLIYTSAEQYVDNNKEKFRKKEGNIYCLTVDILLKEKLLNESILDEVTKEQKIKISIVSDNYQYELNNTCVENKGV